MNASKLARTLLVLGFLAGCSPTPSASPAAPSIPVASPGASGASGLSIAWEPYLRLGGMVDMVHGDGGWVALGECQADSCATAAKVWHSADLEAWDTIDLPQSGDIVPISLSATDEGYFIAAYDFDPTGQGDEAFVQIWDSFDGRSWARYGELRLGACRRNDCPGARGVGRAPNRSIVVGAVVEDEDDLTGQAYVSDDEGFSWREMTIATFSRGIRLDRIDVQGVEPSSDELFLIGEACGASCAMTVWSTTDGEHWAEEQSFGPYVEFLSIAADRGQRVAAVTTCPASGCTTDVWTGVRSTAWTRVLESIDIADPHVTWTGEEFVLVGVRDDRFASYVSRDGLAWSEAASDALGGPGTCGESWLAGGPGAVMFGVPGCTISKGVVERAR